MEFYVFYKGPESQRFLYRGTQEGENPQDALVNRQREGMTERTGGEYALMQLNLDPEINSPIYFFSVVPFNEIRFEPINK